MKFSTLTYAVAFSVLIHSGLLWSPIDFNFLKSIAQKKELKVDPVETVEIVHFYSGSSRVPPASQAMPPIPLKGKSTLPVLKKDVQEVANTSPLWITDDVTYASYIRQLIVNQLAVSTMPKKGTQKAVEIAFTLDRTGRIQQLQSNLLENPDPYARAAVEALKRAAKQFPPFPETVQKQEQKFSFMLVFSAS